LLKLHLGCGENYIEGWVNVDFDSTKADEEFDLTKPFPYHSKSVDFIFAEHILEHFTYEEGLSFLKECHRVLKTTGIFRLSTPDLSWAVDRYLVGAVDEWKEEGFTTDSPCKLLNYGMRLWGHKFVYDMEELQSSLQKTGFIVKIVPWRISRHRALNNLECRSFHKELIVEVRTK